MQRPSVVYKVCTVDALRCMEATGKLPMTGVDAKDGFVHLSVAEELVKTLNLYYCHEESHNIKVLAVDLDAAVRGGDCSDYDSTSSSSDTYKDNNNNKGAEGVSSGAHGAHNDDDGSDETNTRHETKEEKKTQLLLFFLFFSIL